MYLFRCYLFLFLARVFICFVRAFSQLQRTGVGLCCRARSHTAVKLFLQWSSGRIACRLQGFPVCSLGCAASPAVVGAQAVSCSTWTPELHLVGFNQAQQLLYRLRCSAACGTFTDQGIKPNHSAIGRGTRNIIFFFTIYKFICYFF